MDAVIADTPTNPLVGTWQMLAWYNQSPNGVKQFPLGETATGYINYSTDGYVFVHLMASDRQLYAVNDPFGGTEAEDSAAIKSQITYAGTYTYKGDEVVHHVTHASCPNWIGTDQFRQITIDGERLILSAEGALFQGEVTTAYVVWKRAD